MSATIPADAAELRALRLWHFEQALHYRRKANTRLLSRFICEGYIATADFHSSAVATLDPLFPEGSTAEKDFMAAGGKGL